MFISVALCAWQLTSTTYQCPKLYGRDENVLEKNISIESDLVFKETLRKPSISKFPVSGIMVAYSVLSMTEYDEDEQTFTCHYNTMNGSVIDLSAQLPAGKCSLDGSNLAIKSYPIGEAGESRRIAPDEKRVLRKSCAQKNPIEDCALQCD